MTDRPFTPHELRQKATSILDQVERIVEDRATGRVPAASEIDAITTAVATLCVEVERTARGVAREVSAAVHLVVARTHVERAAALVDGLLADRGGVLPDGVPFRTPVDVDAGGA